MATSPVTYSNQGPRLTVNAMLKDPLLIRQRMLRMADKQFIMEALLRNVGATTSGVVQYEESSPQFADQEPMVVAEGGEIPLGTGSEGLWKAAATIKLARGIEITREARDRNRFDLVQKRMNQVRNTMVRAWERRLFTMFSTHPGISTVAGGVWSSVADGSIRANILDGIQAVTEAVSPTTGNPDDFLGFTPDTIVIPQTTMYDMLLNTAFIDVYKNSPIITKSPIYTGTLEREILGLTVMTSRFLAPGAAYILERGTAGGYSDERSLSISPTREEPNRECWRSNVVRRTAMFLDEPGAVCKITYT